MPVDKNTLHIILMCIIEHWRMPQYEEQLSPEDFSTLEQLREKVLDLRDDRTTTELRIYEKNLGVMIRAFKIGFGELTRGGDGGEFHTIVGQEVEQGQEVLRILESYLSS